MTRDMDTVKMSYEEVIDTLKGLVFGTFDRTTAKERDALDMAIKALQTESSADVIPIPKGVTNGEVVEKIFGKDIYYTLIAMMYVSCCEKLEKWWDAPYKGNLSESEDNIWHDVFISL